jgi:hypothetical protein
VIIRIAGEGQYRFPSSALDDLNDIDDRIVEAVGNANEEAFKRGLAALLELVRSKGQPLSAKEIVESEIVLPYASPAFHPLPNPPPQGGGDKFSSSSLDGRELGRVRPLSTPGLGAPRGSCAAALYGQVPQRVPLV